MENSSTRTVFPSGVLDVVVSIESLVASMTDLLLRGHPDTSGKFIELEAALEEMQEVLNAYKATLPEQVIIVQAR